MQRLFPPLRTALGEYLMLGLASLAAAVAVLAWSHYLSDPYWGETSYFLARIDLVNLGFTPYRDFEYDYGPFFLYAPVALDGLSGHWLGIENAYAACLALAYPIGFTFLFLFQRMLNLPDRDRPWILLLTFLIWFITSLGFQYTPLRYTVLPFAIAVGTHPAILSSLGPFSRSLKPLLIGACCFVCLMVSPEMGLACALGFVVVAVVHFLAGRAAQGIACLVGVAVAVVLPVLFSRDYFDTAIAFGSGACNFPFYPNVDDIIIVVAALYVLPRLAGSIWWQPTHPLAPFAAGICAAVTALMPAAMGHCDGGHVMTNGLMLFVLLFAALAQIKRSLMVTWGVVFGASFIVLSQVCYWNDYLPGWQNAIMKHDFCQQHPELVQLWTRQWNEAGKDSGNYARLNWRKVVPYPNISDATTHSTAAFTQPLPGTVMLDRYCKIRASYRPVYPNLNSPADVALGRA